MKLQWYHMLVGAVCLALGGGGAGIPIGMSMIADADRRAMQEAHQYKIITKPSERTPTDEIDDFLIRVTEACSTYQHSTTCIRERVAEWKELAYGPDYYLVDMVTGEVKLMEAVNETE